MRWKSNGGGCGLISCVNARRRTRSSSSRWARSSSTAHICLSRSTACLARRSRCARRAWPQRSRKSVLPMLWTGLSEHHMSLGGTITVDFQTFFDIIRCVCESVVRHGFRRIVLLNGHGGNENALRVCADELSPKLEVPIVHFTYWHAAERPIAAVLEKQDNLWHACEAEMSMCMALRPELVAEDRLRLAEANRTPDVADVVGKGVYRWRSSASQCSTGIYGYPSAASREKGEKLFDAISRDLREDLQQGTLGSALALACRNYECCSPEASL
nr:creatininase family protein [Bradyrhizobium cytisi]